MMRTKAALRGALNYRYEPRSEIIPMRYNLSAKRLLIAGVSAMAIAAIAIPKIATFSHFSDTAYAQEGSGNGGGGGGSGGGSGGSGGGSGGSGGGSGGSGGDGGAGGSGGAAGKGGPSADSDGKGPNASMGGGKDTEGKPNWAGKELTDIGRMNVIKSPESVLQCAIDNLEYDAATQAALYSMTAADFAAALLAAGDLDGLIDSPVANLALLSEYWDGTVALEGVTPASFVDFSGILIGTAADKTSPVTTEQVEALAAITGVTVNASAIAAAAKTVQDAIVDIHG